MDTDAVIGRLRDLVKPGDAILSGGFDPVSLMIQIGTKSRYSHVAVVTDHDRVIEAYDYALTPEEDDDGVYRNSIREFLTRCRTTRQVTVVRPRAVDVEALREAADHLERHAPAFPSTGMGFLALCGLSRPVLRRLPEPVRRRATLAQVHWTADGTSKLHCAEAATRLYVAAGVTIRFLRPTLDHHLNYLIRYHPDARMLPMPTAPRSARPGVWPTRYGPAALARGTRYAVASGKEAVVARMHNFDRFDGADLIMPGDFAAADPFATFREFRRRGRDWIEVA